ncbi:MAG: DUF6108 family protein [Bacteroidales bacterium]|nr:DUF6108 family protein [Bacteroidales bacterium]
MKYKKNNCRPLSAMLLCMLMCALTHQTFAHKPPAVFAIFEKYGSQQGVTMLEASEELMKNYQIIHFKSIIFKDGTAALPEIREAIIKDKTNAGRIKESLRDGLIYSGYYRFKTEDTTINRYLIFKVGEKNKTTLIYIEGKLTPEQLIELLK